MFAYKASCSDSTILASLSEKGQSTIVRDNFDSIGRIVSKEIDVSGNNYSVNYTYNKTRITKEEDSNGETIQYGYSNNYGILGQIIHKKGDQVMYKEQVGYDKLLRVISETDELGGSHTYTYDRNGNMLRHVCVRNGTELDFQYTYDSTIKDKLLSMKEMKQGKSTAIIDYSTTNKFLPTKIKYGDGSTRHLSWQGKRLISITGSSLINYVYNAQGLRTSKTVDGDTTSYLYEGTKVIQMTKNVGETQYVIDFVYDANGMLIGLNTTEGQYFYRRDITGNITGILDSNGAYVVRYRYDAWGNVLSKTVNVPCIASNHNPFIYKGYMYDEETGWYYLQSRYYIPSLCRFLSPDSIDYADPETIGGLNLYAYCNNDPINFCDFCGKNAKLALADSSSFSIFSQIFTGIGWFVNTLSRISTKAYSFWNSIPLLPPDDIMGKAVGVSRNDKLIVNVNTADSYKTAFGFMEKCMTVASIGLFFLDVAFTINNYAKDDNLSEDEKIAYAAMDIAVSGAVLGFSTVPFVGGILGIAFWLGYELGWKEPARRKLNL